MGYATCYTLEAPEELILALKAECEGADYALEDSGDTLESCKWYEHEEDLRAFSKKHPKVLFKLSGEGESQGDDWVKYFRNGQMQTCPAIVTRAPFDARKLK